MTIEELAALCKAEIEKGNGNRDVMLSDYRLGNSHKRLNGNLVPMESAHLTTIPKKMRKNYIELS